jgi:hypothetical protein
MKSAAVSARGDRLDRKVQHDDKTQHQLGGTRIQRVRSRARERTSRRCARRPSDLACFHGTNERISVENYAEMIRFFHRLVENLELEGGEAAAPR